MFRFNGQIVSAANLAERVEQIRLDSLKPVQGAEPDFKQRLKDAMQRRLSGTHQAALIEANVSGNESFARKIADAVKTRTATRAQTVKEHAEQVKRENARYKPFQRRPRTKGE